MKCLWEYTAYENQVEEIMKEEISSYANGGQEKDVVSLYPDMTHQVFEGFEGALTEAAACTWHRTGDKNKTHFLGTCCRKGGLGYTQAHMALDSCDASLGNYSAMEDENDRATESFSLEGDEKYILPFLKAVEDVKGEALSVMLSP